MTNLPQIRLHVLCPPDSPLEARLQDYFGNQNRYPISLISVSNSIELSRSLIREHFPNILLLVDVADGWRGWTNNLRQFASDVSRDFHSISSVVLTDVKPEEMTGYLEDSMDSGIRKVVNIGTLGGGMISAFSDVENAILQAYEFVRNASPGSMAVEEGMKTIVVTSGKGGVGTSTIASALAGVLARDALGKRVALVDFDVQFGAVRSMLRLDTPNSLAQLAAMNARDLAGIQSYESLATFVSPVAVGNGATLHVLPSPRSPLELSTLPRENAAAIVSTLSRVFDHVVIDLPARMTDAAIATLLASQLVLVVCEAEVLSVRACSELLRLLDDPTICNPYAEKKMAFNKVWGKKATRLLGDLPYSFFEIESLFPGKIAARFPYEPAFIHDFVGRGQLIASADIKNGFLQELNALRTVLEAEAGVSAGAVHANGAAPAAEASKAQRSGLLKKLFN